MIEYAYKTCPVCGIHYAFDLIVDRHKKNLPSTDRDRSWYCPNGHSLVYTESIADKYRREAEQLRQQNARLSDERQEAERAQARAEAALKRHKKRSAAGTCPCCKRTFANMAAHMKREHPQFVEEAGAKVVPLKRAEA